MDQIQTGTKSFTSRAAVDDYLAGFNTDDFSRYCAYYRRDICMDLRSLEDKTLEGYFNWIRPMHHVVTETLVAKKVAVDVDGQCVAVDFEAQFRGRKGFKTDNFAGKWGHVYEGEGPLVHMTVWYHLDLQGRIQRLESTNAYVMKLAPPPPE